MEVFKSFLNIIVVVLSFGVAIIAGQNGLLSARCAARCLTEHRDSLRQGSDRNDHRKFMLNRCRKAAGCFECMKPCGVTKEELAKTKCELYCEGSESLCKQSCMFLYFINTVKAGDCPKPETATGFEAVCLVSCRVDGDCADATKCCPNMCGYACREPSYYGYVLPGRPYNISLEERKRGRSVKVTWLQPESPQNDSGTTIYVVEHRKSSSFKPVWKENNPWETILVTQSSNALVRTISAGHWYQFRVAAVTQDGSRGFSLPSPVFKSSRKVQVPSRPQNVTEGVTTLRKGKVDLTIHWQPPKVSDMPVWKYTITWRKILSDITPVLVRIPLFEKTVPGNVLEFKLNNLQPGTTYQIQIEAIVQYGNRQLRSRRTSKNITTYAPPKRNPDEQEVYPFYKDIIEVENLHVVDGLPYFDQGSLKAKLTWNVGKDFSKIVKSFMIYWTPKSCDQPYAVKDRNSATSDVATFEVYDLQYECHYEIEVLAVTKSGVQCKPSKVQLTTPICQNILVKHNSLVPDCPERVPQVPRSPRNVSPTIIKNNCSVAINVTWTHPNSDMPISTYLVEYEISGSFREALRDSDGSVYKPKPTETILGKVTHYLIPGLKFSELYVIRLFAVSQAGRGDPAFVEILTPKKDDHCATLEDADIPRIPRKVFARIDTSNCSLALQLTWKKPKSDLPIESYELVYNITGPFKEPPSNQSRNFGGKPEEIKLNTTTSYILEGLRPSTAYELQLYAVSQAGRGVPAFIEIITPPILPCGSDKDPKPPDGSVKGDITPPPSSTVFISPDGSTTKDASTSPVSKTTVSIPTNTHGTLNNSQTYKPDIYRTFYYIVYVIYHLVGSL